MEDLKMTEDRKMTEDDFRKIIKEHNYFYEMSDYDRSYQQGKAERAKIRGILHARPEFQPIWDEFVRSKG